MPIESFQVKKATLNRSKKPTSLATESYWPTSLWLSKTLEPPLSTPPLSPADMRSPTLKTFKRYYDEDDDSDDDQPLSSLLQKKISLLNDEEEEGDDELIPIAYLNAKPLLSAAEKYKAKVKAKYQLKTQEL